jgi:hypothetical protein
MRTKMYIYDQRVINEMQFFLIYCTVYQSRFGNKFCKILFFIEVS